MMICGVTSSSHFCCGVVNACQCLRLERINVIFWFCEKATSGETWYERKYGAKPEDSQGALKKAKEALGETVRAPFSEYLIMSTDNSIFKSIIRTHTGVASWIRLFASINSADGGCEFFEYDLLKTTAEYFHIPDVQRWDVSSLLETNLSQYLVSHKKIY